MWAHIAHVLHGLADTVIPNAVMPRYARISLPCSCRVFSRVPYSSQASAGMSRRVANHETIQGALRTRCNSVDEVWRLPSAGVRLQ